MRWAFLLLLVPSVALANWSVTPPAGWKRETKAYERDLIADQRKAAKKGVWMEARAWRKPSDVDRMLVGLWIVLPHETRSSYELAGDTTDPLIATFKQLGFTVINTDAPEVKTGTTKARLLKSTDLHMHVQVRAIVNKRQRVMSS